MKENVRVPLTVNMKILCVLFTVVAFFFVWAAFKILPMPIEMEDGGMMPQSFKLIFIALLCVVEAGILFMIVPLWHRMLTKRGAMTLTPDGITDTFIQFTIMAFWTTLRIKTLPWEALKTDKQDATGYTVDVDLLPRGSANAFARFLLRFVGFNPLIGRTSVREIEEYRRSL